MTTIAWVFARGGSKGVKRKNLRIVGAHPLLGHAIMHAQAATLVGRVMVSTDDQEIADVARFYGAEVPWLRPAELATDDAPEWLCWQHAVGWVQETLRDNLDWTFVSVPCTSPLRLPEDIDAVIRRLHEGDCDAVITMAEARRNPWFNQVAIGTDGHIWVVLRHPDVKRRQDAPVVYDVTTVAYAARPEFILRASGLWAGRVWAVVVPQERALDIDTEQDLRIADFMMRERDREAIRCGP